MSWGVSGADIVTYIKICHNLYDEVKNVPNEYSQVLEILKDVGDELTTLETRLKEIGHGRYGSYSDAPELRKDLQEANRYFDGFAGLQGGTGITLKRLISTSKFTWSARKITGFTEKMKRHQSRLRTFREDIILQATLSHLNLYHTRQQLLSTPDTNGTDAYSIAPSSQHDSSSVTSGVQNSILSKATRSVGLANNLLKRNARAQSRLQPITSNSPSPQGDDLKPKAVDEAIEAFVKDVVCRAEKSKLYLKTANPGEHTGDLEKIAEWLDRIQQMASQSPIIASKQASKVASLTLSPNFSSEGSNSDGQLDIDFSHWQMPSVNPRLLSESVEGSKYDDLLLDDSPSLEAVQLREKSFTGEEHSVILESPAQQKLHFQSRVFITNKHTGNNLVECQLAISTSPGSTCIWIRTGESSSRQGISPADILSSMHQPPHITDHGSASQKKPLIFRHSIENHTKSYPGVIHPSQEPTVLCVNKSKGVISVYVIEFYTPQFVDVEGDIETIGFIRDHKYAFENPDDRDLMRELLYGKRLLAKAGYERAPMMKACNGQSLSIWSVKGAMKEPNQQTSLYLTLPANSCGKPFCPDSVVEFIVLGCDNLKSAAKIPELSLNLQLQAIPSPFILQQEMTSNGRRESFLSTSTNQTKISKLSFLSRSTRSSSTLVDTYKIHFSQDENLRQDKIKVIQVLSQHFKPD